MFIHGKNGTIVFLKANELLIKKMFGSKLLHANPTGPYFATQATGLSFEAGISDATSSFK